jgi:hypothetical protein
LQRRLPPNRIGLTRVFEGKGARLHITPRWSKKYSNVTQLAG